LGVCGFVILAMIVAGVVLRRRRQQPKLTPHTDSGVPQVFFSNSLFGLQGADRAWAAWTST
jgi:hypothetical protein